MFLNNFKLFSIGPTAQYYQQYNFEREPWWPKFDRLRSKFGITIVKGDKLNRSRTQNSAPKFNGSVASSNQVQKSADIPASGSNGSQQQGFSNANSGGGEAVKPPIKKRKPPAPEPNYPKCTALYEYNAADSDELSFRAGDILYIVKEGQLFAWVQC